MDNTATADTNAETDFNGASTNSLIHAELDTSHCPDSGMANDITSSSTQDLAPGLTSFQDFDPLQDCDIFQDFDPLQDWDVLEDPHFYIDTEEILKNSENLSVHFKNNTQMGPGHTGPESESHTIPRRDSAKVPLSRNRSLPQPVFWQTRINLLFGGHFSLYVLIFQFIYNKHNIDIFTRECWLIINIAISINW